MASQCWINLGADGTFASSGQLRSTPDDVVYLLRDALEGATRLVLFFHGGLVNEASGLASAERMADNYGATAASLGVVWETGLGETVRDNLRGLTESEVFKKALSWVLAKAAAGDNEGAKGAAGGELTAVEIEAMLNTPEGAAALDAAFSIQADVAQRVVTAKGGGLDDLDAEAIARDLEYDFASDRSLPDLIDQAGPTDPLRRKLDLEDGARGVTVTGLALFIAKVIVAVVRRYRAKTAHDALPTAVEELLRAAYLADVGKFAWDAMKTKAQRMWIDDGESPDIDAHGGGYILRRLEVLQKARPDMIIDVVGHSAGSIAICEMLAAIEASKRRIRLRNILFLAPAVRFDLFARWIPRGPQIFKQFRMFTMTDAAEKADRIGGALYPRSLLYIVSGCFEDRPDAAILGMDRFLRQAGTSAGQDYDDVRRWLLEDNRLVYSPSAAGVGDGLQTSAHKHGAFDDDAATLASLLFLAGAIS
ncbi:hypothetical protein OLZ32_08020 [Rhizobium sp. 1AS11]|uniref:alpha/beta hydrolase n=1 Tax=Rhizobium acaciae TaxID=2989736 RepID=UPI002221E57F|nr:alpha/beta hydrolase [Rhizobium acaciae]MCW1408207.1 hypothetical protein [Rhizobium acaciae]MCW1740358.1 hypothetical protein [Rhizobium acaciae]